MEVGEINEFLSFISENDENAIKIKYDADELGYALDAACVNGKRSEVKGLIDKAINCYPTHGRIIRVKALMLLEDKRNQDAINLLSLVPGDDNYLLSCIELIGLIFMNSYQFQKAIDTYTLVLLKVEDKDIQAFIYYQRSICYQYLKNYAAALSDLNIAIKYLPFDEQFYREIPLNFQLLLGGEPNDKTKQLIEDTKTICLDIIKEYDMEGAYIVLAEIELLKLNIEAAKKYAKYIFEIYPEDKFIKLLLERIADLTKFKKRTEKYLTLKKELDSIPEPIIKRNFNKHGFPNEPADEAIRSRKIYDEKTLPIREKMEKLKVKMKKSNEIDYEIFMKNTPRS